MSLKFLNKKSWHTMSMANQKKVALCEQAEDQKVKDREKRVQLLLKEQRISQTDSVMRGGGKGGEGRSVSFLYETPAGLEFAQEKQKELERAQEEKAEADTREKARAKYEGPREVSYDELKRKSYAEVQAERFPQLKNAPTQGTYTKDVITHHNPLGMQIRNVRCMRCGKYGHKSGERECELRDENPFDSARQEKEDPLTIMQTVKLQKLDGRLEFKGQGQDAMVIHGGYKKDDDNQQLVCSDSSSDSEMDLEATFLESLSTKEMKILLKAYKKQGKTFGSSSSTAGASSSKRRRSSSSSSSDSDDDSSSSDDRKHRKRKTHAKKKSRKKEHHYAKKKKKKKRKRSSRGKEDSSAQDKKYDRGKKSRSRSRSSSCSRSRCRGEMHSRRGEGTGEGKTVNVEYVSLVGGDSPPPLERPPMPGELVSPPALLSSWPLVVPAVISVQPRSCSPKRWRSQSKEKRARNERLQGNERRIEFEKKNDSFVFVDRFRADDS